MRRARPLLGTLVDIRVPGEDHAQSVNAAFTAVARVHRLMSAHDPASDVSSINRAAPGEDIPADSWTLDVLRRARQIWAATDGLFDCCVAPWLQRDGDLPATDGPPPDPGADLSDVQLLPHAVRLRRPLRLTLDGIAKGFAVDRAVAALKDAGVARGAVNAGGDLRIFGPDPEPVHVRHPADPLRLVRIGEIHNAAVATSALYFSRAAHGSRNASPIVDPRTRRACLTDASATVIAHDCMTADALTKPLLIDPGAALPAIERLGARAVRLSPERAAA